MALFNEEPTCIRNFVSWSNYCGSFMMWLFELFVSVYYYSTIHGQSSTFTLVYCLVDLLRNIFVISAMHFNSCMLVTTGMHTIIIQVSHRIIE